MQLIITLVLLFVCMPQDGPAEEIQFFGDVLLSRGVDELIAHQGKDSVWRGVQSLLNRDAINIANLEGAVGEASSCVANHNPCFPIKTNNLDLLTPFDIVSLANNHSLDLGLKGLKHTAREASAHGVSALGEKEFIKILRTRDGDVGIVALTDVVNEKSDRRYHNLPDSSVVLDAISRLKRKTSYVAVYVHWGRELDSLPTERMRSLAKQFVLAGADIVVGHHPHVIGTAECVDNRPVIYSLGNFLFDQKYESTKQGAVLRCSIVKDKLFCQLIEIKTPMNSFIPQMSEDNSNTRDANQVLSSCAPRISRAWSDKFTHSPVKDKVLVDKSDHEEKLSRIALYDMANSKLKFKSSPMPIQSLQPVDVNGDGIKEVMLIQDVYSTLDEEIAKRVYIYSMDTRLKAMWRGSALSRPLLDALFISASKNQTPVLVALHSSDTYLVRDKTKPGRIVMSYKWNGFGFTGIKETRLDIAADRLSFSRGYINLFSSDGSIVQRLSAADYY